MKLMKMKNSTIRILFTLCLLGLLISMPMARVFAHDEPPSNPIDQVKFEQRLNQKIPLKDSFKDENGQVVKIGDYLDQKPAVLIFAYYNCPMLCNLALKGLAENLSKINFDVGRQFNVITVSIDPRETPAMATAKKATYMELYNRPGADQGWHFLTGDQTSIDQLTQAAGFHAVYDPDTDEYAHPTGVVILTPQGKISRYILGIDYKPTDLRLGLVEASANKIGTPVDQFFLLCYHYNPITGKYTLLIDNIVRLAGLATVLLIGGLVLFLLWRERRGKSQPDTGHKNDELAQA